MISAHKSIRVFFKQLSIYSVASIDLLLSLELAFKRIRNKKVKADVFDVLESMKSGKSVSTSFEILNTRGYIDSICQSILFSSERSGNLPEAFKKIYEYLEMNATSKNELMLAFSYPVLILSSALFLVIGLIYTIFPKIVPLFMSMNIPIPRTTKFMISGSHFLIHNALNIALMLLVALSITWIVLKKNPVFKEKLQLCILYIPIVGKMILAKEIRKIAYSCSLLMRANTSLYESLQLASSSSMWSPVGTTFNKILMDIQSGKRLSQASEEVVYPGILDGDWIDLVTSGESTGTLQKAFEDISIIYESYTKETIATLSRWSEPLALTMVAIITLFVALSVVQPMYAIIQHVNQ